MVRCILYSNESGSKEGVYFTEDFDIDANECVSWGCKVDKDFIINDDFPIEFPLDTNLDK